MFVCFALLWCTQYWENWYLKLNKRILRFIVQDYNSPYDSLLSKVNPKSPYKRRLQTLLIILYKSLFFSRYPGYLRDMFSLWSTSYSLRGNYILSLPSARSTTYGLHSFLYMASKLWHSLQMRLELLTFLISSATFYSMTPFNSLNIRMLKFLV